MMKLEITKEQLEKLLGYEIQELKLEPLYNGETCIGLSVLVIPIQTVQEITITENISTRMLEVNGVYDDRNSHCLTNRYLIEYLNESGAYRQTYVEAVNSQEAEKTFHETHPSATFCYMLVL